MRVTCQGLRRSLQPFFEQPRAAGPLCRGPGKMRACLRCGGSDPGLTPNPPTLPQDTSSCNSEKPRVSSEESPVVWDGGSCGLSAPHFSGLPTWGPVPKSLLPWSLWASSQRAGSWGPARWVSGTLSSGRGVFPAPDTSLSRCGPQQQQCLSPWVPRQVPGAA